MKNKKGQLWVSAVLYIALGVVAITLVLSAGIPLINKMKDKNTVVQAKEVMNAIDKAINDVRKEGVGSRRFLSPVIVKGGELIINPDSDEIKWKLRTGIIMVEPCSFSNPEDESGYLDECKTQKKVIKEGNLNYYQTKTFIKDEYDVRVDLNYKDKFIDIETDNPNPLTGKYSFAVENIKTESKIHGGDYRTFTIIKITVT